MREASGTDAPLFSQHGRDIVATFAALTPDPAGVAFWVVVGLVVGLLAGWVATGSGYRPARDLAAGFVGAIVAGYLFGLVTGVVPGSGTVGAVVAFTGACAVILLLRTMATVRADF
jgi:uncharacterized membrane protein YeaQ/YmgE (transglycosylase-associated protein family)